jgi:hypothetical protein
VVSDTRSADEQSKPAQEADAAMTKTAKADPGMICDTKNLYQGPEDRRGRFTWSDKFPEDLEEDAENETTAQYALLIRNRKCFDSRKRLEIDSIVIQSPLLKKVLSTVLKGYPGVTCELERLDLKAPFSMFVHRWAEFLKAIEAETDPETKQHLELLYKILKKELNDVIKVHEDFIAHGVVTFEHIWTVFQPGGHVYTSLFGQDFAARVKNGFFATTQCGKVYKVQCENVSWDGENFGLGSLSVDVAEFDGTCPISELEIYPLEFHSNKTTLRKDLIKRGKMFEAYAGFHYKA